MSGQVLSRILSRCTTDPKGCFIFQGTKVRGYGQISIGGKRYYTHRVVFESVVSPIPTGLVLDHLCSNPSCCNPSHLEPVLQLENVARGRAGIQNRIKTHCPQGHPYDEENTYHSNQGRRHCKTCLKARDRR